MDQDDDENGGQPSDDTLENQPENPSTNDDARVVINSNQKSNPAG